MRRRTFVLAAVAALGAPAVAAEPAVVTLFGDSIVAGYGLAPADGPAAQLQAALAERGVAAVVRNAGVPGDPSPSGLGRVDQVRRDTAVCVVEFGGNDQRLGYPVSVTRDSLDAIVKRLKARGVTVILVGVGAGARTEAIRNVAADHAVAFYPDAFAGVGRELRQADGVHPNASGAKVMARGLAPLVAEALRARAGR